MMTMRILLEVELRFFLVINLLIPVLFYSDLDALLHVVKSSLGTGVLAIADGFKNAGMVIGLVGTIIVGILCAHCTYVMVSMVLVNHLKKSFFVCT